MCKKDKRFELESTISTIIFDKNRSTVHFDYHVDINEVDKSIKLDLYTRNARSGAIFLLHQVQAASSISALEKVLEYLNTLYPNTDNNPYSVYWKDNRDPNNAEHVSYFYEKSEQDVLRKFFYNRKEQDYTIRITLNPIS